jgi:hypothetical protein
VNQYEKNDDQGDHEQKNEPKEILQTKLFRDVLFLSHGHPVLPLKFIIIFSCRQVKEPGICPKKVQKIELRRGLNSII